MTLRMESRLLPCDFAHRFQGTLGKALFHMLYLLGARMESLGCYPLPSLPTHLDVLGSSCSFFLMDWKHHRDFISVLATSEMCLSLPVVHEHPRVLWQARVLTWCFWLWVRRCMGPSRLAISPCSPVISVAALSGHGVFSGPKWSQSATDTL